MSHINDDIPEHDHPNGCTYRGFNVWSCGWVDNEPEYDDDPANYGRYAVYNIVGGATNWMLSDVCETHDEAIELKRQIRQSGTEVLLRRTIECITVYIPGGEAAPASLANTGGYEVVPDVDPIQRQEMQFMDEAHRRDMMGYNDSPYDWD